MYGIAVLTMLRSYMLYKDACNGKSNQRNLGTIKCSNLCTEIIEYTSHDEVAVCNLASVVLPKFITSMADDDSDADMESSLPSRFIDVHITNGSHGEQRFCFNHTRLHEVVRVMVRNLNKIIDINFYPIPEARTSNMRHRPIGVGVQGLADAFQMLRLPFDSDAAKTLNKEVFETIYFAAVDASCELAEALGPYDSFKGSPASEGKLQFDLWGVTPSPRWPWTELKERVRRFGLRNSLLVGCLPIMQACLRCLPCVYRLRQCLPRPQRRS